MAVDVRWEGDRAFDVALAAVPARVTAANRQAVAAGLALIENAAKRRAGEGGRHARGTPTPATRGRGPAVITGTLRRSIVSEVERVTRTTAEGRVGPTAVYSRRVELEFVYPYMAPGLADVRSLLGRTMRVAWAKAVSSG